MLYLLKGRFQKVVRWIGGSWMTANMATLFGCVFIVLVAASYYCGLTYPDYRWLLLLVPVFIFLRLAMAALDGMLSREHKTATAAGELWNETLDIVGDTVCYGVIYFVPDSPHLALTVFLILTWAAEYFGVLGKSMPGGKRRHEAFGGGKADRAVWMGLLAFIVFCWPAFFKYSGYYIGAASVLVAFTCVIRVKKTLKLAKGKQYESYTYVGR